MLMLIRVNKKSKFSGWGMGGGAFLAPGTTKARTISDKVDSKQTFTVSFYFSSRYNRCSFRK